MERSKTMTIQLFKKGNDLVLESQFVDLKITSDRKLWVRRNWKKESQHVDTGVRVPMGLSRSQKELWLMEFRKKMIEKQGELLVKQQDRRVPSMLVTLDDEDDESDDVEEEEDDEEEDNNGVRT
jgi:hypothetical protein